MNAFSIEDEEEHPVQVQQPNNHDASPPRSRINNSPFLTKQDRDIEGTIAFPIKEPNNHEITSDINEVALPTEEETEAFLSTMRIPDAVGKHFRRTENTFPDRKGKLFNYYKFHYRNSFI